MSADRPARTPSSKRGRPKPSRNGRRTDGKKRGDVRRDGRLGIAGSVIFICAVISALVALHSWANNGQIYGSVEVGSLHLGGMDPEEARDALEEHATRSLGELRFTGPAAPAGLSLSAEDVGFELDVAAAVDTAYAVGRRGNVWDRLADRIGAAFGTATVPTEADYRPEAARAWLEHLARRIDSEPRDASIDVSGGEVEVVEARAGFELDVAATTRNVDSAIENLDGEVALEGETLEPEVSTREAEEEARKARAAMSGPVVLVASEKEWTLSPADMGRMLNVVPEGGDIRVGLDGGRLRNALMDVYSSLVVEPVEAGFFVDEKTVEVTPGRAGKRIEEEKLFSALEAGLFDGKRAFEVPVVTVEPELTTAEAERVKPTTVLGEYGTDYTWDTDPGRRTNMTIASDAISGTVLAPGEVFSYNAATEPLDYEPAKVIENGGVDYSEGGGLSQVSTTLYMAANLAGMEILEANPHYAELSYVRPGLDTTVWFGALDLRFKNTTGSYVLIQEWMDEDGFNYARIWGAPNGIEVEMWSEKVFEGTDAEGKRTTKWVTYKTVTRSGRVVFDGVFRRDTYKELDPYEDDQVRP